MKASSVWFRVLAVLLALALVGGYVYQRSGGNLLADTGLDRTPLFARDAQVAALEERLARLEQKIDMLLVERGYSVTPIVVSTPVDPAASPPSMMFGSKSAPMFRPEPGADPFSPAAVSPTDPFGVPVSAPTPPGVAPTADDTVIFYLTNSKADEAAELLREALGPAEGVANPPKIVADMRLNGLIVKGEAGDLDVVEQLLKVIDPSASRSSIKPSDNPPPTSAPTTGPPTAVPPDARPPAYPATAPLAPFAPRATY